MNHSKRILAVLAVGVLTLGAVGVAFSEDDDDERGEDDEGGERSGWVQSLTDAAPIVNKTYNQECGSCHMAYQPGLLPPQAWAEIMDPAALGNHYGDDASLSDDLRNEISTYLGANSADLAQQTRSHAFAVESSPNGSKQGSVLPRITETPDFKRKHDEIPARLVAGNPKVGSFSKCEACHRTAPEGDYNERQISIPGHGRWSD